jgi:hypothetical protein
VDDVLRQIDEFCDAVPRQWATALDDGPLRLFTRDGPGWPFYARPVPGGAPVTAPDVERMRGRQRALGVPEAFEWVPAQAPAMAGALAAAGLPAHRLTVELTESTAIGGGATSETLQLLREMGVRLSLDDFGTGASTLSLLATCPVDQIKLDRSFAPIPGPDAIATAVIQLATAFGVEAVAEGVETEEQAERLHTLGYTRAQGFLFARPLPPAEISRRPAPLAARP